MKVHRVSAKIIRDALATKKPFEFDTFKKAVEVNVRITDWWMSGQRKSPPKAPVGVLLFQGKEGSKVIETVAMPKSLNRLRTDEEQWYELAEAIDWKVDRMRSVAAIGYVRLYDTSNQDWEPSLYSEVQTPKWRTTKWWTNEGLLDPQKEDMDAVRLAWYKNRALMHHCLDFFDPHDSYLD